MSLKWISANIEAVSTPTFAASSLTRRILSLSAGGIPLCLRRRRELERSEAERVRLERDRDRLRRENERLKHVVRARLATKRDDLPACPVTAQREPEADD